MADDAKTKFLRAQLPAYLKKRGIDPDKWFSCLNPEHQDHHPSMHMDEGGLFARCFSKCGRNYSIFELEAMRQGISILDFPAVKKAVEDYLYPSGVPGFEKSQDHRGKKQEKSTPKSSPNPLFIYESISTTEGKTEEAKVQAKQDEQQPKDFSRDHAIWHADKNTTDKWSDARGINSEMVKRFSLGYDAERGALIVPCTATYHCARLLKPIGRKKYDNPPKPNKVALFNEAALDGIHPVWIVEGPIDAISIIQAGKAHRAQAMATNGTSNTELVINAIKSRHRTPPMIMCFDDDESGRNNAAKLVEFFKASNIAFMEVKMPGQGEDANELLKRDSDALKRFVGDSIGKVRSLLSESVQKSSLTHLLGLYQARRSPNIYLPSGFPHLDRIINGGFHAGHLIMLGAQSSLGKSTFVLQIANNIAARPDGLVIFFSLEMIADELLEKSISMRSGRVLCQDDVKKIAADDPRDPVQDDDIYSYSETKRTADEKIGVYFDASDKLYEYSDNLHVIGIADARSTAQMSGYVFNIMMATGRVPLVIIDHLQMVGSGGEHYQDRRNEIDAIMLDLIAMAKGFNIPVMVISELNRGSYDKDVSESAFKESSSIEYSADLILALQFECLDPQSKNKPTAENPFNADEEKCTKPRHMQLKVIKQRGGEGGQRVNYDFWAAYNEFEELDRANHFASVSTPIVSIKKKVHRSK